MKRILITLLCLTIISVSVFVAAQPEGDGVKVRLQLVDAGRGEGVSGIVRVFDSAGKPIELPNLFDRMTGLTKDLPGVHWYVLPAGGADVILPRGKVKLNALSGLETALAVRDLDLTRGGPQTVNIKLDYLFRPDQLGLTAGNTHLHLRNFNRARADEYLKHIPAADGLKLMFISYLERDKDDKTYITNDYPVGDLPQFTPTGVLINNGEEHRHNFLSYGEGYGHVMFLNIKELVKPVSIGPGITGGGFDDLPLRPGIDNARKQGGTIIWCHNGNGFEDVLNILTGRLDALNVFDGSRTGRFEDSYYRYLNIGVRLPISTGTDWFMYDFSRVYAQVRGKPSVESWLSAIKAGRCQATNGPLLTLTVDGKSMGDVIDLQDLKTVKIQASAVGRDHLTRLELIHNGRILKTQLAAGKNRNKIELAHELRVDGPGWFAVRIESDAKNEFGKTPFAHTSPVYVTWKGRGMFDIDSATSLLKQVEEGQATIAAKGRFSDQAASKRLLKLYDDAAQDLRARITARQ